ncbi:photosystem II stability/assembly factor-like uncharacterized protein [Wenyingzhuangia heitensis]|uniref:Photosystem II stability/assembly factor-like uncharacterized protein n=1 Tax=Wenyingzhuangia heitensis TaxID=1487859 RepID=A0ABX0UAP0_9FLAO|nr:T9SS type A sorting domain-containing protein [Wenyingzhuangia heitensis]NIJ45897.1 photosystem II stability/assembly factor-like uncharacterized protein [Wenyingzhuangia heitensis]
MKLDLKIIAFWFVSIAAYSQLNTTYFDKLKSEKVNSTDKLLWQQFGPGMSGYCEEFWCHPTDVNVMFQSPDMYNSYGSWDNGLSWQTIKDVDGTGKDMRRIKSIEFSRQNQDFGLAIDVRGELYKTNNKGRNWTFVRDMGGQHSQISVDPTNDAIWYMGGGSFWNVKSNHRKQNDLLGYVYAYADYGHIYKSIDKGETWQKKKTGLPATLDVGRVIVNPTNNNHVFIATNSGVYKSTDGGESWQLSGNGLPNNLPRDMTSFYDATTGEFILYVLEQTFYEKSGNTVVSKGGVYKSTDGGNNWTSISGNLAMDMTQITSYTAQSKYWRAIAYWFDVSQDEAKTQYPEYPSAVYSVYNRIVVNPKDKNDIYVTHNVKHDYAFGPGDVWKTNDGGQNWLATARSGTYWSEDKNNAYWSARNNPKGVNTEFAHLKYEKEEGEEYYGNRFLQINKEGEVFICLDQQIMRSNNKGVSWNQVDDFETEPGSDAWVGRGASNLPGRFMLLETGVEGRMLFCSGEHGLWQSADLGAYSDKNAVAVTQIEGQVNHKGATSIANVAVNPKNPNEIFTLQFRQDHRGYLRKSADGGKTWENWSYPVQYGGNLSSDNIFQYSLTIDYENPENMYFCVMPNAVTEVSNTKIPNDYTDFGVFRSTDAGKTWSIENTGFPTKGSVNRIKIDPENPSVLYAALNEGTDGSVGGLYKTINKGNSWSKITIPSTIKAVNNVFVDRNNKYIYISCGREEGTFSEGGVWRSKDEGATWEKIFDMPYIWQTETSPVNPNIITVNVPLQHENKGATTYNPGAYISFDGGVTWEKVNKNMGQPDTITDFKPDPKNENVFWIALKGSGWAKGVYQSDEKTISITTTNNACPYVNNGAIKITSVLSGSFKAVLQGSGVEITEDFTKDFVFQNLASGIYNLEISSSASGLSESYLVSITQPQNLEVEKTTTSKKVEYQLTGAQEYMVVFNQETFTTTDTNIELKLESGINTVQIQTDKECQGVFKEEIIYSGFVTASPNPFTDTIQLNLGEDTSLTASVVVYTMTGTILFSADVILENSVAVVPTTNFTAGVYIVSVKTKETNKQLKMLKK